MNQLFYREFYEGRSVRLKWLLAEHSDDEQFISIETCNRYLPKKKPTLRIMLNQLGNIRCEYLGEKSPYYLDEGYLDFVCWPESETNRKNKKNGIHIGIGVRSET